MQYIKSLCVQNSNIHSTHEIHIQVGDVIKWGFYWTKSWKVKLVVHQNFFSKLKIIHLDHEENVKKIKKNPGTAPVPGLKVFFEVKIVVKNTLGPGTGAVPGFFYIFFMVYMYVF